MDRQSETVTRWDVNKVHAWFASLGFTNYESQIKEQDIDGEILVLLDHEALKDLGVRSVGHRVSILKAIYNLKIQYNVPVELGQYIPPSAEFESAMNVTNGIPDLRKIEGAIQERNALIYHLSDEVKGLRSELAKLREEMTPVLKITKENKPLPEPERNSIDNPSTPSTSKTTNLSVQVPGISVTNFSRSPTYSSDGSSAPPSPHSPYDGGNSRRHYNNNNNNNSNNNNNNDFDPRPSASYHQTPVINDAIKFFGNQSYKSFRVSLEDPCHKVLPAALKKYKITDDWRQYALFIRFGSPDHLTERCLSYDEKPLLLFQKLKEAYQNPVFMLKNIKEIKSPVATAEEIINSLKANKKRRTTQFLNKELPPAPNEYPSHNQEPPPAYELTEEERSSEETLIEGNGTAIAIYPYVAELDDELNVVVGDIFKIRSRSGGWCFVERDGQTGWVPANFLLETSVNGGDIMDSDSPYVGRGVALMEYNRNTNDELSMKKDDKLRIYKKKDYWLYCEINNVRGWVPSWYVRVDKEAVDDDENEDVCI